MLFLIIVLIEATASKPRHQELNNFLKKYFILCILYVYGWREGLGGHMCHGVHGEVRGQLEGVCSLPSPYGSQGLK